MHRGWWGRAESGQVWALAERPHRRSTLEVRPGSPVPGTPRSSKPTCQQSALARLEVHGAPCKEWPQLPGNPGSILGIPGDTGHFRAPRAPFQVPHPPTTFPPIKTLSSEPKALHSWPQVPGSSHMTSPSEEPEVSACRCASCLHVPHLSRQSFTQPGPALCPSKGTWPGRSAQLHPACPPEGAAPQGKAPAMP